MVSMSRKSSGWARGTSNLQRLHSMVSDLDSASGCMSTCISAAHHVFMSMRHLHQLLLLWKQELASLPSVLITAFTSTHSCCRQAQVL